MRKKPRKKPCDVCKRRNSYVTVMWKRHSKSSKMRDRRMRRVKDTKNSWQREWE